MGNRDEYFKEYNRQRAKELSEYAKEKYQKERKKRLTKAHEYYILNRGRILLMAKLRDTTKSGHAYAIWKATKKYAKKWGIPYLSWEEFKAWAMTDPGYELIYKQWEEALFDKQFGPVVIRTAKKQGFVGENLKWDYRENYAWWSQELQDIRKDEEAQEKARLIRNKGNAEWRKKTRAEWKAKRKK